MPSMLWLLLAMLLLWGLAWLGRRALPGERSPTAEGADPTGPDPEYALEIGDELDLHGVHPRDVDELVDAFVDVAVERHRTQIKIIHGKGTGRLRQRVRERLARHPAVAGCTDAVSPGSGWGATIVRLRTPSELAPEADGD